MTEIYKMHGDDKPDCFASHMGTWLIETNWLTRAVEAIKAGLPAPMAEVKKDKATGEVIYNDIEGLAIIDMVGPMMKGQSKFGGNASTVLIRQQLRAAEADPLIKQILLRVTSPGGHVAGTQELANEVKRINAIKKITVQVEDLMASAALWVGAQADQIFSNQLAEIGSIGVVAVLHDTSKAYAREGIKVHVVSTGPMKGAGAAGTEITDEIIESVQGKVNAINEFFIEAIADGRNLDTDAIKEIATGETFMAEDAFALGLIDKIQTTDETVSQLVQIIRDEKNAQSSEKTVSKMRVLKAQRRRLEMSVTL